MSFGVVIRLACFAGLFTFWLIEVGLCWVSCVLWVTQVSGAATVGERTNGAEFEFAFAKLCHAFA